MKNKKTGKEKSRKKIADTFDDDDFFDDCPVCQATKFAQKSGKIPTFSELLSAMKQAKEKGAVSGGPLLEENYSDN